MPGDFDYYVLTLSWSPTYCETEGRNDYDQQCSGVRPYAFVLHGLWPQYEQRGWPELCRTNKRPFVPEETVNGMLDIMPSPRLVIQEYRKHGTCSGLDPADYFGAARKLYESIKIPERFKSLSEAIVISPEDIEKAFVEANPQLKPDMIEVACSRDRLRDIRICFDRGLHLRGCGQNELDRKLCFSRSVTMPPVRGGGTGPHGGPTAASPGTRT